MPKRQTAGDCQVRQERFNLLLTELRRMAPTMEQDEALDPVNLGLLP